MLAMISLASSERNCHMRIRGAHFELPERKLERLRSIFFRFIASDTLEFDEFREAFEILLIDFIGILFKDGSVSIWI